MLRKVLIAALIAGLVPASAGATKRSLLMPGVTYERQVEFTSHGPVALHVIKAPQSGGLWSVRPVLSNGAIVGRERVTTMQQNLAPQVTAAGVNGDFGEEDGRPSGMLMLSGVLAHAPHPERSSIGIGADGSLRVERVRFFGTWRGNGQRRPLGLNEPPGSNGVSLFTPIWGPNTPPTEGAVEVILDPLPSAAPNGDLTGSVVQIAQTGGGSAIPRGGAVLVGRGTGAGRLAAEVQPGGTVTVRLLLNPPWTGIPDAVGGGPVLVRDGKPVFRHGELFSTSLLARNARTGIGQLPDGRLVLVVVDGQRPGYSVGMTNFELAQALVRLGAITAAGLGVADASTMAFDGKLLSRPSARGEPAVSEGVFVLYAGVYAAPPAEEVLSPNGDGVADAQSFAYKLVRPAQVTVTLIGPDRQTRDVESGTKAPGVYRFSWSGVDAPEGRWRLSVAAVDDQGQTSRAERIFSLNRTLGSLALRRSSLSVRASFTLTRSAKVSGRVETRAGAVIAAMQARTLTAGARTLTWNGRIGRRRAHSGRYVFRVVAENPLGRVELAQPFSF